MTILIFIVFLFFTPLHASNIEQSISWEYYTVKKTDTAENLFGNYWQDVLRFNKIDQKHFHPGIKIKKPNNPEETKNFTTLPAFYEPAQNYKKYILIDLKKQFLGCYEYGHLKFSFPIASGKKGHDTPTGDFKVIARHRDHHSSKYKLPNTRIPYPMTWAVHFYTSEKGVDFWIHGRDMPGYPASHGCVGLYDEEMQKKYYGKPANPIFTDAKKFYLWLFPDAGNDGNRKKITDQLIPVRITKD